MHIQINETMFIKEFRSMGRHSRSSNDDLDQFSLDALKALYEYYTDLEEDAGESIECDVIAISCVWSEESVEDIVSNYFDLFNHDLIKMYQYEMEPENLLEYVVEKFNNETFTIALDNGKVLYQNF